MFKTISLLISLSMISFLSWAHEGMHVVSVAAEELPLKPEYTMAKYDVETHEDNSVTILVTTEGDCEKPPIPFCTDPRSDGECKSYYHSYCEHEILRYPLPPDQVIFDGNKRLKYIEDGHYLTIARHDRYPFFPLIREWNFFFTYATLENHYSTLNLLWFIKEEM